MGSKASYKQALAIDPGNVKAMCHLSRLSVKSRRDGEDLRNLLERLICSANKDEWRRWARRQISNLVE